MKLYSLPLSPFASRVRLALYRKGLHEVEIVAPPDGGTKGDAFLAINPMGQVPTLEFDDGFALPESATILEYLEDAFPEPSLRPADKRDLARARLFLRLPDLYFQGAPRVILGMHRSGNHDQAAFDLCRPSTVRPALYRPLRRCSPMGRGWSALASRLRADTDSQCRGGGRTSRR